jgi:hypothetical protein
LEDVFYRSASWAYSTSNTDLACDVSQTINFLINNVVFDRYRYGFDGTGVWKEVTADGNTVQNIDGNASNTTPPDWGPKTAVRSVEIYQDLILPDEKVYTCSELVLDAGITLTLQPGAIIAVGTSLTNNGEIHLKSGLVNGNYRFAQLAPTNAELNGSFSYDILITEREWHHMSSPIVSNLDDVEFFVPDGNGIATTTPSPYNFVYSGAAANIYKWVAADAAWASTSATEGFHENGYTIFFPVSQLPLIMRVNGELVLKDQNAFVQKPAVNGNAGTNQSPGFGAPGWAGTDNRNGWNIYGNQFLSFINVERLVSNYGSQIEDLAHTVYAYQPYKNNVVNGPNYFNHNGSTGQVEALNIPPFQAFFQQHIVASSNGNQNGSGNNNKGAVFGKRIRSTGFRSPIPMRVGLVPS